ncbi:MAG: hypothetical protein AVDCRST_MAG56-8217, partial [uncultured Cytophagales bacterium]
GKFCRLCGRYFCRKQAHESNPRAVSAGPCRAGAVVFRQPLRRSRAGAQRPGQFVRAARVLARVFRGDEPHLLLRPVHATCRGHRMVPVLHAKESRNQEAAAPGQRIRLAGPGPHRRDRHATEPEAVLRKPPPGQRPALPVVGDLADRQRHPAGAGGSHAGVHLQKLPAGARPKGL